MGWLDGQRQDPQQLHSDLMSPDKDNAIRRSEWAVGPDDVQLSIHGGRHCPCWEPQARRQLALRLVMVSSSAFPGKSLAKIAERHAAHHANGCYAEHRKGNIFASIGSRIMTGKLKHLGKQAGYDSRDACDAFVVKYGKVVFESGQEWLNTIAHKRKVKVVYLRRVNRHEAGVIEGIAASPEVNLPWAAVGHEMVDESAYHP
jgi:hypothetical protein